MFFSLFFILVLIVSTWHKPMWGIAISANAFLINAAIGNTSGFAFALVGLGGPIICFCCIAFHSFYHRKYSHTGFKIDAYLVLSFFIISLFSVFFAYNERLSLEISIRFLVFCASFYFAIQFVLYNKTNSEKTDAIHDFLFMTLSLGLLIGSYALYKGNSASEYMMRLTVGNVTAIPLSILVGQSLLIALYLALFTNIKNKLFFLLIVPLLFYVMMLTNTRSTIIGLGIGLLFIIAFRKEKLSRQSYFIFICSFIVAVPLLIFFLSNSEDLFSRSFSGFSRIASGELGESEGDRLIAWWYAMDAFGKAPFFGLGTGNFGQHYIAYPHNMFLEVLSENGLLGFSVIFTLIILGFRAILRNRNGVYLLISALFLFSFFVAQVSLTMWMHKTLFIWLAILMTYRVNEKQHSSN